MSKILPFLSSSTLEWWRKGNHDWADYYQQWNLEWSFTDQYCTTDRPVLKPDKYKINNMGKVVNKLWNELIITEPPSLYK